MKRSSRLLLKGAIWTIGGYGVGQVLRFGTNIFLAKLLAPELFGVMLIVNTLAVGISLISDVGINQNIIYHKDANDPEFYNTAWSVQAIRSLILWLVTLIVAAPVSLFYQSPILVYVLPLSGFCIVLLGFTSVSLHLLQKRMQVVKLNAFEMAMSAVSSAAHILLAWLSPTIWALAFGSLVSSAATMLGSYFLLPGVKQRLQFSSRYSQDILRFGKWIFVSSIVYFLSTNFDRLYLAKIVPLKILGVYGIARAISELIGLLVSRIGNYVLFPLIASHALMPRTDLREQLAPVRIKFMLAAGVGFSLSVVVADLPITILYDQRYQAASWMLPALMIGTWSTILAVVNESTLLGLGRPGYLAIANAVKFVVLLIVLPLLVNLYGLLGGIVVVAFADLARYIPILVGQRQERFSFGTQDLFLTLAVFLIVGLLEWLRWIFGFGTSFDNLPTDWTSFF